MVRFFKRIFKFLNNLREDPNGFNYLSFCFVSLMFVHLLIILVFAYYITFINPEFFGSFF